MILKIPARESKRLSAHKIIDFVAAALKLFIPNLNNIHLKMPEPKRPGGHRPKRVPTHKDRSQNSGGSYIRSPARKRGKEHKKYTLHEERPSIIHGVPAIIDERELPENKKIIVFAPNPESAHFMGTTIHMLAEPTRRNKVRVAVLGTGHKEIPPEFEFEGKKVGVDRLAAIDLRRREGRNWARDLGLEVSDVGQDLEGGGVSYGDYDFLDLHDTYDTGIIEKGEAKRLKRYVRKHTPDVIMIPHVEDMHDMNSNTRALVLDAQRRVLRDHHRVGNPRSTLVFEYPTHRFPTLPDANIWFIPRNHKTGEVKHKASEHFVTQAAKDLVQQEKLRERASALTLLNHAHNLSRDSPERAAMLLKGDIIPEHFTASLMEVEPGQKPLVKLRRYNNPQLLLSKFK
jgi:hypothetical protein